MDVLTKSHAAAARVAAGIDGMLALRVAHGFRVADIASIALGIPRIIEGRLTNKHPVDLQAAQMSLPYCVAVAAQVPLTERSPDLTVVDFEAGLSDPAVHGLEERTTIALDEEVEAASNDLSTAARVSVTLNDGRALSMLVPAPKGSPTKPFTEAEQEDRFTRELSTRIPAKSCAEIVAVAHDLDRLDPGRLCGLLSGH
jgi:2-methylcitrate dehydratase PrpD